MTTLVVPGVRVEARFDVLPPLPAAAGIVGVVGIVDRPTKNFRPEPLTQVTALREVFGPGTEHTMPEALHALANGASEIVVAPVDGGSAAKFDLKNADGDTTVQLRCRSNGAWGEQLNVQVLPVLKPVPASNGNPATTKQIRATLVFTRDGRVVERHSDLIVNPGAPGDLVDTLNRDSRLVVASDAVMENQGPKLGDYDLAAAGVAVPADPDATKNFLLLVPASGVSPENVKVTIEKDNGTYTFSVSQAGAAVETLAGLSVDPDNVRYLPHALEIESKWLRARMLGGSRGLPKGTPAPEPFTGGASPTVQQYRDALGRLEDEPRVDLVLTAVEPNRPRAEVIEIHEALLAHAVKMSDEAAPRIAFGSLTNDEANDLDLINEHAGSVRSRNFVLVSPPGVAGAVAGMIGRMKPQFSPTFKNVPLHGIPPASYREGELNRLLGPSTNLCVVQSRVGRGVVVLRGLNTFGDQISVTRVAHQCVRETRAIAEGFIGRLNTDEARSALKQQIVSVFTRMERDTALVPSVDGADPAFIVNVYSTQEDFANGIVRIDIAVRPVRAIDFIYATIRVKY